MTPLFNKLLNVRPTEWPRLLLLYLMAFVVTIGLTWGETIVEAAFLRQVGVEALSWFFIAKALFSILAVAVYSAFADRVTNDKLLIAILMVGVLGIVGGLVLLGLDRPTLAYPLLYLLIYVPLADIFAAHWYTYVNGFYDTRSAKRIVPILGTAVGVGAIVAGLTMEPLNSFFAPSQIIILWLAMLVMTALLAWLMPYLLKEGKTLARQPNYVTSDLITSASKSQASYLDNIREGYRYVLESTYLRWLALGALLLMLLLTFVQYETSKILLERLATTNELETTKNISNFIARVTWIANLIILPLQLLLLSRVIGRVGVGNANLIYPTGLLAISGGLIFWRGLLTAALAHFGRIIFYSNIGYPIESLLYNAVPLRIKGRARVFIGGIVVPVGALLGGMLLSSPLVNLAGFLSTFIGLLAVAFVINALVIRQQYSRALIKLLEQEDFSALVSQSASRLTVADPATLTGLRKKLEESTSYELTLFMAKLISEIGGSEAISILGQAARAAVDGRTRAALINVLVAADTRGEAVRQLYTDFLADPDGQVRQSALAGLEQLARFTSGSEELLELALKMLDDPNVEVRVQVLPILLRSNNPVYQASAIQALNEFLSHEDAHQRVRGVQVLEHTDGLRFVDNLVKYLADSADEVRLEAALAVEALTQEKLSLPAIGLILEAVSPLRQDPIERVRQAALVVLRRIGTHDSYQELVGALADPSPQVRATAVNMLVQIGKGAIPIVHPLLDSSDPQQRKMAAVILSRINQRDFGPLVESYITGNLLIIYRNLGRLAALMSCAEYPSISVLQSALREQNQQLVTEIFYLLTAIREAEAIKTVAESLRSETAHVRVNAVEALEALTNPQTTHLLAPLFEPEPDFSQLLQISQETWDMSYPDTATTIKQLLTTPDDPWLRAMITLALGEMGAALGPGETADPKPQTAASDYSSLSGSKPEARSTRHPQPASIFDTLAEPSSDDKSLQEPQPEARPARRSPVSIFDALTETGGEDKLLQEPKSEPQPAHRPNPADLLNALTETGKDEPSSPERPQEEVKTRRTRPTDLLGVLIGSSEPTPLSSEKREVNKAATPPFTLPEIEALIDTAFADPFIDVRLAARAAKQMMAGVYITNLVQEEGILLSTIEKIIFLKEVPFFEGMAVDQLKVLANVCEEELFEEDTHIFNEGDPGGALYVVVSGRVAIEQEKRKGSFARLATIEAHSYFGEMNLFDNSPRSATAIALQDTLTLRLRREPLIALARQYPDLSLELIKVLSQRLRDANDRIADLTRTRTRELQKFYDKFD